MYYPIYRRLNMLRAGLVASRIASRSAGRTQAIRRVVSSSSHAGSKSLWGRVAARGVAVIGLGTAGTLTTVAFCDGKSFLGGFFGGAKPAAEASDKEDDPEPLLPLLTLEEVKKHRSADSLWVTYEGVVYDVTAFLEHHPGGRELLMTAAGLDLGHFFANYTVHTKTDKAANYLAGMAIGRLSPEEAAEAAAATTPEVHVRSRFEVLWRARRKMVLVMMSLPVWIGVRYLVRCIGFIIPSLGHFIASHLPVSVPGYAGAVKIKADETRTPKVAVIGGGIAGSGAAYALAESGFEVTLFEARDHLSGNAHTFDWDVQGNNVRSCVSVTAWPPSFYKNYMCLLDAIDIKTTPIRLSWFLYSKVPGAEGYLWPGDPKISKGSLRERFQKDFERYGLAVRIVEATTKFLTLDWFGSEPSMYKNNTGFGFLNPFNMYPLHHLCRVLGVSQEWWDVVFTPYYTASFLTDKLDNLCAVIGPLLEAQIPLLPTPENSKDSVLTTCVTWADAGQGIRDVFERMTAKAKVHINTRVVDVEVLDNGMKRVRDEFGNVIEVDRVVFACACNAVGNMHKKHNVIEDTILASPEYADDHHPATGHMHAVMHNDANIITPEWRNQVLSRGSNYVEVTKVNGDYNIENSYNFGVQTPSMVTKKLEEKVPMLITHALGEGKNIDPSLVRGQGNHARAHPLYSGWNVSTMLALRLIQGRNGIYYCANWTTPGNCHDMSFLSGVACAHAIGADYPFEDNKEAKKDLERLRSLMGI